MSRFIYKFDSIKKTKDILEKKVQKELAEIDHLIEDLRREYIRIEQEKDQVSKNLQFFKRVSDLKQLDMYKNELKNQMENVRQQIDLFGVEREKKLDELLSRSRENKMFGILEEVHLEEYKRGENQKEEITINEIAGQKFARDKN